MIEDPVDRQEFERIYMQYRKQMYFLAKALVTDHYSAEDIVHDVFTIIATRYMNTLRKIDNENDLRNYLMKATKNTCLNYLQKKAREQSILNEENKITKATVCDEELVEKICEKMEKEQVIAAIKALPEIYREVLYYRLIVDLSPIEIAKILNRNLTTVKKQVTRGKNMLREFMENA